MGDLVLFPLSFLRMVTFFFLIDRMIRLRGPDTVTVSKVKGHAD